MVGKPDGPFVPGCSKITWLSIGVVCLELTLGILLPVLRWRIVAASLAIVFFVFVQVMMNEFTFALTMCGVLSIFFDEKTRSRLSLLVLAISLAFSVRVFLQPDVPFN